MTAAIELAQLSKSYGGVKAVDDVSLDVADGSFTSIIGPSGSGKTTVLSIIAGFEVQTSGSVRLYGRDVGRVPPYERGIGVVFQSYALFPHLTVFENVAFPLRVRGVERGLAGERVRAALNLVGLATLGERFPRQLSGGQQQRVALARAFVFKPRVLLMDEPLGALDKSLREHMQSEIKALQRRLEVTVVYVTHDQGEALSMSDRIVLMSDGRVRQSGAPAELYRHPKTAFVARFLGETNLLTYTPVGTDADGSALGRLENGVIIEGPDLPAGSALLSLRPEDIRVAGLRGDAPRRARVAEVVFLGDCMRCRLDFQGLSLWAKLPSGTSVPPLAVGGLVALDWPKEALVPLE